MESLVLSSELYSTIFSITLQCTILLSVFRYKLLHLKLGPLIVSVGILGNICSNYVTLKAVCKNNIVSFYFSSQPSQQH